MNLSRNQYSFIFAEAEHQFAQIWLSCGSVALLQTARENIFHGKYKSERRAAYTLPLLYDESILCGMHAKRYNILIKFPFRNAARTVKMYRRAVR